MSAINKSIPPADIQRLRDAKLITQTETVILEGDILIAVNALDQVRRVLVTPPDLLLECRRKVLHD